MHDIAHIKEMELDGPAKKELPSELFHTKVMQLICIINASYLTFARSCNIDFF